MLSIHILRDGKRLGIFQPGDIRILAAKGYFLIDDLAWHKGMANWRPLGEVVPGVGRAPARRRERFWISHRIPFFVTLPLAPAYPMKSGGRGFLIASFLLFLPAFAMADFSLSGSPTTWVPVAMLTFLVAGYLPQVVHASAIGDEIPPPFPSLERDWKTYFFLYGLAALSATACFIPLGIYVAHTTVPLESPESRWLLPAGIGFVLAPMAILRAIVFRSVADALHPLRLIASIITVLFPYLVLLILAARLPAFLGWFWRLSEDVADPVRFSLLGLLGLYGSMVCARLLGVISYSQRKRLSWF